jgi:hypothetical protein
MTFLLAEDAALKTSLSGITVADEKSANRPVNVWFGYPDVEIRTQNFPFITIDLISMRNATERQSSGEIYDSNLQGTVAPVSGVFYKYEIPIAYDLIYQITSYSRHPRHDRAIIFQLNQKFPAMRGHLAVPDALGTSTAYRHMFLESFYKNDAAEGENGNKRILRNIYTVRVVSEMTPNAAAAVGIPDVNVVSLNKNANNSWSETTVPDNKQVV